MTSKKVSVELTKFEAALVYRMAGNLYTDPYIPYKAWDDHPALGISPAEVRALPRIIDKLRVYNLKEKK